MKDTSKAGTLNKTDWRKAGKAALVWSAPVVLIYINSVIAAISGDNHVIALKDFVPNTLTVHAIIFWILSQVQGIFLRFVSGK